MPRLSVHERITRNVEEANSPRGRLMTFFREGGVRNGKVTLKPDHVELTFPGVVLDGRDVSAPAVSPQKAEEARAAAMALLDKHGIAYEKDAVEKQVNRRREPGPREETITSYRVGDTFVQDYTTSKTVYSLTFNYKDVEPLLPRGKGKGGPA